MKHVPPGHRCNSSGLLRSQVSLQEVDLCRRLLSEHGRNEQCDAELREVVQGLKSTARGWYRWQYLMALDQQGRV